MAIPRVFRPARGQRTDGRSYRFIDRAKGVEANARLTGSTAAVLLILLAAEGVTVIRVGPLLTAHVFIGVLVIPPVLLKIASTGYRFVRYYAGAPAYQRKGPPPMVLRLLGPLVVLLTVILLVSGVVLLFVGPGLRHNVLDIHRMSFIAWFAVMTIHVLCHLLDTARLAPRDLYWRTRKQVVGAGLRQWMIVTSLAVGLVLAMLSVGRTGHFFVG